MKKKKTELLSIQNPFIENIWFTSTITGSSMFFEQKTLRVDTKKPIFENKSTHGHLHQVITNITDFN